MMLGRKFYGLLISAFLFASPAWAANFNCNASPCVVTTGAVGDTVTITNSGTINITSIEAVGAGGDGKPGVASTNGGGAGAGGNYAEVVTASITSGTAYAMQVGIIGTNSGCSAVTSSSIGNANNTGMKDNSGNWIVAASGGSTASGAGTGGAQCSTNGVVGTTTALGGKGGNGVVATSAGGGGGGGAGGPNGNGAQGAAASGTTQGSGGQGDNGTGGAAGSGASGAGGNGTEFASGQGAGGGGAGGSSATRPGGTAGTSGGGGGGGGVSGASIGALGAAKPGVLIITYTVTAASGGCSSILLLGVGC